MTRALIACRQMQDCFDVFRPLLEERSIERTMQSSPNTAGVFITLIPRRAAVSRSIESVPMPHLEMIFRRFACASTAPVT